MEKKDRATNNTGRSTLKCSQLDLHLAESQWNSLIIPLNIFHGAFVLLCGDVQAM